MLQSDMGLGVGTRKITLAVTAVLVVVAFSTGCRNAPGTNPGSNVGPTVIRVIVSGKEFQPGVLTIPVGTTVVWINHGGETHTVTSSTGLFNGFLEPVSGSFNYTFVESGNFEYHCDVYDYHVMAGRVVVQPLE